MHKPKRKECSRGVQTGEAGGWLSETDLSAAGVERFLLKGQPMSPSLLGRFRS